MSLINRMLRELSARESRGGEVLSGIQVPQTGASSRSGLVKRLALLLLLVAGFTAVFWMLMTRKSPQEAAPPMVASAVPAPAAPPPAHLHLDTELSSPVPASPPPPRPAERQATVPQVESARPVPAPAPSSRAAPERRRAARAEPTEPREPEAAMASAPAESAASEATPTGSITISRASPAPAPAAAKSGPPKAASARDAREAGERYSEALRALGRGEPKTAEQGFRSALSLDPAQHAAREALIALLIDQDRLDEARATLDDGLAIDNERVPWRRLEARLDLARGEPALAVKALEHSPPPVAADPEYHALLGSAYQRLGKHQEAAQVYQRLMEFQPEQAHWWAAYGISRDALGDVQGALGAYARARQLGGLEPRVLEHINHRSAVLTAGG